MNSERERAKTTEEKHEEAALELALYQMLQKEGEAARESASSEDEAETQRMAAECTPRILASIDQRMKRHDWKHDRRQGARLLKAAACIVLVANMCLTIATATSTTVRARVMEFLTEINSSYMDIRFVDTGLGVEVPEEWTENYYPSHIPDDYVLQFAHSVAGNSEAEYVNARDEILRIGVYSTMATVINTEKAKITHTTLHGAAAIILEQPFSEVDIIWANGDRYFIISSDDYETTLAVAESVGVIQK